MFSITEIGKNRKKLKISNKRNTVGDFYIVATCDDNLWNQLQNALLGFIRSRDFLGKNWL
jgi:hypothetical protein